MRKPNIQFVDFPKIARLSREIIITEKIDGTNAQIYIPEPGQIPCSCSRDRIGFHGLAEHAGPNGACSVWVDGNPCMRLCGCGSFRPDEEMQIFAGSRTRWITPEDDNHGFARWVQEHKQELLWLGPGSHFGEWWGSGIQRGYGLKKGEKRFSLFNTSRWGPGGRDEASKPGCCGVVPVLYRGEFDTKWINDILWDLGQTGSKAAPGFMRPEGIVIYHVAGNHLYKKTLERDNQPKGASNE